MSALYKMYKTLKPLPFGHYLFSKAYAFKAPYFSTIKPLVTNIEPGRAEVEFKRRRRVLNHIGTFHVISICNAMEMAMGAVVEATIPNTMRWLPKGMNVTYPAKSESQKVRIVAEVDPSAFADRVELPVIVKAYRDDDTVVVEGEIIVWVTNKPQK